MHVSKEFMSKKALLFEKYLAWKDIYDLSNALAFLLKVFGKLTLSKTTFRFLSNHLLFAWIMFCNVPVVNFLRATSVSALKAPKDSEIQ